MNQIKTESEELADEVTRDFLKRQDERRLSERGWQLNMNFVSGNQYCGLDASGEIVEEDRRYFWQNRRVFNHIAAIIDARCSKLGKIRPELVVRPASDEESDKHSASLASAVLAAVSDGLDLDGIISEATLWSEVCGTAFYKVVWKDGAGSTVGETADGKPLRQGDVRIYALSPFEIYPYSLSEEKLEEQPSIIHAKAMPVQDIYALYGVKLAGRDIDEFSLSPCSVPSDKSGSGAFTAVRHGYELVIERYERPTADMPDGRLTAVAGGELLYDGKLPYVNGDGGGRGYPFVRQCALPLAGSFFGASVVDRLIPLQRAYNAVKNRKHEFLNRISMGTIAVEDGSVDVEELIDDGLTPGKVLVYRQGGNPPEMLSLGSVPSEFSDEEENLLNEFVKVSGTGDLTQNADSFAGITSATGLQLIIDQDEARLNNSYTQIKRAMKKMGRQILRLYRQYATDVRLMRFAEDDKLSLFYFKGSDISSDDVVLEADSDSNLTPSQRRTVIYEMLDRGLFNGEDGTMSQSVKNKVLEMLGYNGISGERDLGALNRARAGEENLTMQRSPVEAAAYEDHATHITEHTAFLLSARQSRDTERRICAHIEAHRKFQEENMKNKIERNAAQGADINSKEAANG